MEGTLPQCAHIVPRIAQASFFTGNSRYLHLWSQNNISNYFHSGIFKTAETENGLCSVNLLETCVLPQ